MRHFLDLADWSGEDLYAIIDSAIALKQEWCNGGNRPLLRGKVLGMIFQKPSLRTRVSFDVAMQHLGGHAIMLGPDEIGIGKRESIADVARVLSSYTQIIMARVFAHQHVVELARWSHVPVINGLSDAQHPCQAMADILTMREHFGRVAGLRIAFIGDGNNVAASLGQAAAFFGAHFTLASPAGYTLAEDALDGIDAIARRHGGGVRLVHNPMEAVRDADVVYTDTWVSMGQEAEASVRREAFHGYQVNTELMRAAPAHAVVMHDLPAYRGYEITDEVADSAQSIIFQQAENRLHAQKAILLQLTQ